MDQLHTIKPNPKAFPVGSVAYFVDKRSIRWQVDYGIVEDRYNGSICLMKLEPADRRTINGVRYCNFVTPTRWTKLPKGWTYDTKLFEEGIDETVPDGRGVNLREPQAILDAYESDALVRVSDFDHSRIDEQFGGQIDGSAKGTYRLIRNHTVYRYIPSYESISWYEVYKTYAEAESIVQSYEAELARVVALSDYDWSVEQIKDTINRWARFNPEGRTCQKSLYLNWIMAQGNPEEIETRVFKDTIQWKRWKFSRWMDVVL